MKIDMILPGVVCWIFLMLTFMQSSAVEHQDGKPINHSDEQEIHILRQDPSLLSKLENLHPTKFYSLFHENGHDGNQNSEELEFEKRRFNAWAGKRMVPIKRRFNAWAGKRSVPLHLREGRRFNAWAGK
ncbi:unnamed protein product [Didymodactylos carnosus]|uniref:Uncharacterized protein n=1 Tax=Didymodactylos carnosus TaxID=1234261 RepID=A0A813S748_9BILA|nr:unnamed protein product [Didymodactylos carnosus]CAF0792077.1 unnamed protein product [Didymodactylos carnosus]CAF0865956.1 unnamed protein product [Didymodactylos carnosus]CAF3576265.1 unnamed protein product [Didymodactylos carnosus]CAF3576306.1 unnamed protein product [Didymodactylos carnosus]